MSDAEQLKNQTLESPLMFGQSFANPMGIVFQDAVGRIQGCNKVAAKILGMSAEQIIGARSFDLVKPSIQLNGSPFPGEMHPAMVALQTKKPSSNVVMGFYQSNGKLIWLKIDSQPLFQGNERTPYGVVTTFVKIPSPILPTEIADGDRSQEIDFNLNDDNSGRSPIILYADNDKANRYDIYCLLQEAGFTVWKASTGAEAFKLASKQPDLLLLANNLPDIDGFEFCQQLKTTSHKLITAHKTAKIPILLLSAMPITSQERVKWLAYGVDSYLTQPIEALELIATIKALLRVRQTEIELIAAKEELEQYVTELSVANEELQTTLEELESAEDERQQQNQQLKIERQRYQDLFDFAPDGYLVTDPSGKIIEANREIKLLLAVGQQQLIGTFLADYIPPQERQAFRAALEEPLKEGRTKTWELNLQSTWQKTFSAEITVAGIYEASSQLVGLRWLVRDFTARKQTQRELYLANERFELAAAAVNCLIYDWDLATNRVERTPAITKLLGYSLEETESLVQWWHDRIHPEDLQKLKQQYSDIALIERSGAEYRIRHKNGRYIWVEDRGIVVRDEAGRPIRVVGSTTNISDRKLAQANLQQSEERYRSLATAIASIVWMAQGNGSLVLAPEWETFTGQTPEQYRGDGWLAALHPDDRETIAAMRKKAIEAKTPYEIIYRLRDRNEEYRFVCDRGVPILDATGKVREWIGTVTDINERHCAEEALYRSQEIIRQQLTEIEAIYTTAPIGLCFIDTDLRFVRINERLAEINGTPVSDHIGRTLRDILPEMADQLEPLYRQVIDSGEPILNLEINGTNRAQPGRVRDWQVNYYPLKQPDGRVVGVNAMVQEITERKQAEIALKASEERFRLLATSTPIGIFQTDAQGRCIYTNPAWYHISGLELEESLEYGWIAAIHADDRLTLFADWQQAAAEKREWRGEVRIVTKQGANRWANALANPIYSSEGQLISYVGTVEDISDRKQAEIKLKELNATLEQASEQLSERNQELNRFVYIVSHDLKAPLRAIANLSQWIEDDLEGTLDEENQHQMQLLRQRVYRMEAIIDGLLNYSRVGRTEVATETVDVGKLLEEILDSLAPPPTFAIVIQPPMPTLVAKKLLLSQVFANLISNAIKHHPRADGKIEISATEREDYYEFAITDDGDGIAVENQAKIFEIFQTLKSKDSKESTGIGLAIVKKIVESEGGEIRLESNLGEGATFRFTLPKQQ
jgi:PAS domain S-box-containing protein